MVEEDKKNTAFVTSQGTFCYRVVPFGLRNVRATYQMLVNKVFANQLERNMEVYVNDMLVKSKIITQHVADLKETFAILRRHEMRLNSMKCAFRVTSSKFLRFIISHREIEANP